MWKMFSGCKQGNHRKGNIFNFISGQDSKNYNEELSLGF